MNAYPTWPGWETVRLIGQGSFGAVYEIQREVFGEVEKAALKVISIPQNASDIDDLYGEGYDDESITSTFQSHLKSIIAEYSLMRKMNGCTNIVSCDDVRYVQHDDGFGWDIFIKMELLTPLIKAVSVSLSDDTVTKIAKDICSALVICQKFDIVHRDIKPQNIFVSELGDYKLGDFGIAKTVEKTMGGTKIGTYKYMAPEVYNNQAYGSSVDIYSLGLVLYWLLNERRMPFMPLPPEKPTIGMDEQSRLRRFSGEAFPPPVNGSEKLKRIVMKACAFDPKDRYASAAEMLQDLQGTTPVFIPPTPFTISQKELVFSKPGETAQLTSSIPGVSWQSSAPDIASVNETGLVTASKAGNAEIIAKHNGITQHCSVAVADKKPTFLWWVGGLAAVVVCILLLIHSCGLGTQNNQPTVPVQADWSDWTTLLPEYVTEEHYVVEEQVLYRTQTLETITSTETDTMTGWELYDTLQADGQFGPWSDWSDSKVTATDDRKVESKTQYRFRDKETTTSSSSSKDGWEKFNTTYKWGEYGSWSGWSTTAATASDSRQVENKRQYSYRDIWITQEYSAWSSWSSWSSTQQSTSDLKKEESRTVWAYYYYLCPGCGAHMHGWDITCPTWAGGCGKTYIPRDAYHKVLSTTSHSNAGLKDWHGTGKYYAYVDGQLVFKHSDGSSIQYRYATRTLSNVTNYSGWSSYSDTKYTASSTREVRTRTVYRYRDRQKIPTYHFFRWGSWSDWADTKVNGDDNRQVETRSVYRHQDKVIQTIYCFRRWSDWSEYSASEVIPSDTVNVQTQTQYRYKSIP